MFFFTAFCASFLIPSFLMFTCLCQIHQCFLSIIFWIRSHLYTDNLLIFLWFLVGCKPLPIALHFVLKIRKVSTFFSASWIVFILHQIFFGQLLKVFFSFPRAQIVFNRTFQPESGVLRFWLYPRRHQYSPLINTLFIFVLFIQDFIRELVLPADGYHFIFLRQQLQNISVFFRWVLSVQFTTGDLTFLDP